MLPAQRLLPPSSHPQRLRTAFGAGFRLDFGTNERLRRPSVRQPSALSPLPPLCDSLRLTFPAPAAIGPMPWVLTSLLQVASRAEGKSRSAHLSLVRVHACKSK